MKYKTEEVQHIKVEVKNMKTDKKYMMIVTEEDDRYDTEDGYDCDFYADHPWEGNLIDKSVTAHS